MVTEDGKAESQSCVVCSYERLYVKIVASNVRQFFSLVSILVDLRKSPDEARPLVRLGHADLLQRRGDEVGKREQN